MGAVGILSAKITNVPKDDLRKSRTIFRDVDNLVKLSMLEIFVIGTSLNKAFRVKERSTQRLAFIVAMSCFPNKIMCPDNVL